MMLSVVVLTLNEQEHLPGCLESLRGMGQELLVFDSYSSDRTVAIAREMGARIEMRAFDDYSRQRNAALAAAQGDWVFFVDADERATPQVRKEIATVLHEVKETGSDMALFWIPRQNYIFGKWIRHAGWSPDYQPRLLKKGKAKFDPARPVHELVLAEGGQAYLKHALIHYNYTSLREFCAKQMRYTRFEAEMLRAQGCRPRAIGYLGQPVREFVRRYITLQGYKDGAHGLLLSGLMGYYAFVRQRMLRDLWRAQKATR